MMEIRLSLDGENVAFRIDEQTQADIMNVGKAPAEFMPGAVERIIARNKRHKYITDTVSMLSRMLADRFDDRDGWNGERRAQLTYEAARRGYDVVNL